MFAQCAQIIQEQYPNLSVAGEPALPSLFNQWLAQICSYVFVIGIVLVLTGDLLLNPLGRLGDFIKRLRAQQVRADPCLTRSFARCVISSNSDTRTFSRSQLVLVFTLPPAHDPVCRHVSVQHCCWEAGCDGRL